jgi:long-chain acyl-CoA synthetase
VSETSLQLYRDACGALTDAGGAFAIECRDDPVRRVFAGTPANLNVFFETVRQQHFSQDFLEYQRHRLTFAQTFDAADNLAAVLYKKHRIAAGDVVGLAMRNLPEWFIAFFALTRIGAVVALLNSRGSPEEIADAAIRVGCRLVIADDPRDAELQGRTDCPVMGLSLLKALASDRGSAELPPMPERTADDPAIILFTSGTTGRPKGATMTHRNMCLVAREGEFRRETALAVSASRTGYPVEALRQASPLSSSLLVFPMFHISGLTIMLMALAGGGLITLMERWNPAEALDRIAANQVNALSGPSLIFSDLLALPDAPAKLQTVRNFSVGGQATPVGLARRLRETFPAAGMSGGWGQTEASGPVTSASADVFAAFPGTVGLTAPLAEIRVVGADGEELPTGEIGELEVRSPTVMMSYWNDEAATREAFRGGWLRSGDLGRFDEHGLLYIADRAKDMVISAGENIYCAEVERVLSMLEGQLEVALFGVADERLGERAVAAIVPREDSAQMININQVRAHVRAHLADYKVPSELRFDLGPLPRNDLGKVDKAALARRYHDSTPNPA